MATSSHLDQGVLSAPALRTEAPPKVTVNHHQNKRIQIRRRRLLWGLGVLNQPGTVLLTISDMSVVEAEMEVDETSIPSVEVGQEARVRVDAYPNRTRRRLRVSRGQRLDPLPQSLEERLEPGVGRSDVVVHQDQLSRTTFPMVRPVST